ncbi:J domain-containing protein [Hippea sp. KM1]|uniref:J domain-containing protein n=1 Tax=Hippea sp. KM1 TaxID=944481 RepID=UPI00046D1DD6|nr:J domain-containing protein [Hippea sp. KM1]
MDPYEVLGVDSNISENELRRVFLRLAKEYHPDTATTEEERIQKESRFKELTYAYNLIKSKEFSKGASDQKTTKTTTGRDILIKKAHAYISQNNFNAAIEALNQIKGNVDDDYEVNLLYGIAFLRKKRFHQAIKYFQKAVKLNPWKLEGYLYLGEVYEAISLKESARKFYQEALKIDPSSKKAQEALDRLSSNSVAIGSLFRKFLKR